MSGRSTPTLDTELVSTVHLCELNVYDCIYPASAFIAWLRHTQVMQIDTSNSLEFVHRSQGVGQPFTADCGIEELDKYTFESARTLTELKNADNALKTFSRIDFCVSLTTLNVSHFRSITSLAALPGAPELSTVEAS